MTDEESVKATLLQWATNHTLAEAVLSADGSTLSLGGTSLSNQTLHIQLADKSCQYTLASIYLQILDPNQGLIAYRNACKKYGVTDPVKALDKPIVVGYFLGASEPTAVTADATSTVATAITSTTTTTTSSVTAPTTTTTAPADDTSSTLAPTGVVAPGDLGAAPVTAEFQSVGGAAATTGEGSKDAAAVAPTPPQRDHRSSSSKPPSDKTAADHRSSSRRESKDRHDSKRRASSSSGKHHHSHRGDDKASASSSAKKKKKSKHNIMVTNEQLFSNLSMVVDKRQLEQKAQQEITQALSAEGFQVTPEILQQYQEATQQLLANEIPVGNSASILRATNPKKNLSRVLELYLEAVNPAKNAKAKPGQRPGTTGGVGGSSSTSTGGVNSKPFRTYLLGKKPVVLVPKGMTAPVTLANAHEFLSNGRFIPRDVLQKQGRQRSPLTTFTRKVRSHGGGSSSGAASGLLEYEILDNPRKLGSNPKEWERIVAVIVLGQSWQFKDWPAPYNDPVQLFSRTYGYYLCMEGDKIPTEIQGWAVRQGRLNRDKRGLDSVTHASFWNGLDEFMAVHKAELLPQQQDI